MAEKVFPIVRPAHFFFLTVRSGNAWRSNPTIHCKPVSYTHLTLPTTPYV